MSGNQFDDRLSVSDLEAVEPELEEDVSYPEQPLYSEEKEKVEAVFDAYFQGLEDVRGINKRLDVDAAEILEKAGVTTQTPREAERERMRIATMRGMDIQETTDFVRAGGGALTRNLEEAVRRFQHEPDREQLVEETRKYEVPGELDPEKAAYWLADEVVESDEVYLDDLKVFVEMGIGNQSLFLDYTEILDQDYFEQTENGYRISEDASEAPYSDGESDYMSFVFSEMIE